jgi:hypothetical protein
MSELTEKYFDVARQTTDLTALDVQNRESREAVLCGKRFVHFVDEGSRSGKDVRRSDHSLELRRVDNIENEMQEYKLSGRKNAYVTSRGVPEALHPFALVPMRPIIDYPKRTVNAQSSIDLCSVHEIGEPEVMSQSSEARRSESYLEVRSAASVRGRRRKALEALEQLNYAEDRFEIERLLLNSGTRVVDFDSIVTTLPDDGHTSAPDSAGEVPTHAARPRSASNVASLILRTAFSRANPQL